MFRAFIAVLLLYTALQAAELRVNDKDYLEMQGLSVLVYQNAFHPVFKDQKLSAIEIIQHDDRIATDGDVRLQGASLDQLGAVLDMIADGTISGKIAKDLFEIVWTEGGDPRTIVEQRGMKQVTDLGAIEKVVDEIIAKNPDKVADAKTNPKAIGWFVGQVMKSSGGKASPQAVNDLLKKKLGL